MNPFASISPFIQTALVSFGTILGIMIVLWVVGTLRRDISIVDPFWGAGFVIVAWIAIWLNAPLSPRDWLLAVLTTVWGLRLSLYLLWRNCGHGEDRRYAAMREHHGRDFWWVSLGTVILLQAVILWFVSLPLQVVPIRKSATPLSALDVAGFIVWAIGMFFETVGDWQLRDSRPTRRTKDE